MFCKNPFLALLISLFSSTVFLIFCFLPLAAFFMLTTWSFCPHPTGPLQLWRQHKELKFAWSAGTSTDMFRSIQANVRPLSFQWIPSKLTSIPPPFIQQPFRFTPTPNFHGVTFDCTLFFFLNVYLR